MTDPAPIPEARRRRLLFRATHRGTHELDLLIGGFVSSRIATFTAEEVTDIERLLDLPEPDLADWLTGRQPIPAEHDHPLLRAMAGRGGR